MLIKTEFLKKAPSKKGQKKQLQQALHSFYKEDRWFSCESTAQQVKNFFDKIYFDSIQQNQTFVFIFVFGGSSASSQICQSLGLKTSPNIFIVSKMDGALIHKIQSQSVSQLKKNRFVFISKSGKTDETLFYAHFIEKLYAQNQLSLKDKIFVVTEKSKSLLLDWGKKAMAQTFYLKKEGLPGRFSFFKEVGLLQFQAYKLSLCDWFFKNRHENCYSQKLSRENGNLNDPAPDKLLEFLVFNRSKKEIWLCSMDPRLKAFCQWLERAWSESLFKRDKAYPPILRHICLRDLQHGFIEELMAKKEQIAFWALDLKPPFNQDKGGFSESFLPEEQSEAVGPFNQNEKAGFSEGPSGRLRPKQSHRGSESQGDNNKDDATGDSFVSLDSDRFWPEQACIAPFKKRLQKLFGEQKLAYLYCQMDFSEPDKLFDGIFLSYKILFVLSEFFKADIFSNVWVDFFKAKKTHPFMSEAF